MGKSLLILALTVLWAGCEPAGSSAELGAGVDPGDAHAELACAACHRGSQGERGRATVPEASCTGAGCHESGGPEDVQVATVRFPHRDHGAGGEIQASCSGCHTHDAGETPLTASVAACALCHIQEISSAETQECRLCHAEPDHSELTSQGVAVPHSALPWVEIGCVRCHYDVSAAETAVSDQRCRQCHDDLAELNRRAVGRDLHPIHEGVTCESCHRDDIHEVRAMSSVVNLVCSGCHTGEHGLARGRTTPARRDLCGTCHVGVHSSQQRLILGIRPDGGVMPSAKFLAGVTCTSCHIPGAAASPRGAVQGRAEACADCHSPEYASVLAWWQQGLRVRLSAVREHIARADRALVPASDSVAGHLEMARRMIELVAEAGGQHNLELSDRLMRGALSRVGEAYRAAGRSVPTPPDLGREPHVGLCSYCHYQSTRMLDVRDMPADFHETVLGPPR